MSATAARADLVDPLLTNDVLAHLDGQIASAARLLEIVLRQHEAINQRDIDAVVQEVSAFQAEFHRRARIEDERNRLLNRAAATLGLAPNEVTVTRMTMLMAPHHAQLAQTRSAELQRLLDELTRAHALNQSLMRQELAFLDHLLNVVEPSTALGYESGGTANAMPAAPLPGRHSFDLHA